MSEYGGLVTGEPDDDLRHMISCIAPSKTMLGGDLNMMAIGVRGDLIWENPSPLRIAVDLLMRTASQGEGGGGGLLKLGTGTFKF